MSARAKLERRAAAPLPGRKLGLFGILGALLGVLALVAVPSSIIVALIALAPSLIYALVERHDRMAVRCVTAFSLTGMMPVLDPLWTGDNSIAGAVALLSNPLSWLVMYGAVVVALSFLWVLPKGAAVVLQTRATREVAALRRAQERLVREWGEGVKISPGGSAKAKAKPNRKARPARATSADVMAR
jgi:hypothetical protein